MEKELNEMQWWDGVEDPRAACSTDRELWKLTAYQNYAVSNLGRVASSARGEWRLIDGTRTSAGYISYTPGKMGHQLVVLAFDGPAPSQEHTDIRHLDRCSSNNRLTNLAWGTRSENMMDVKNVRFEEEAVRARLKQQQAEKEGTWYGGRTWDQDLVATVTAMYQEKKIRLEDVARILGVSTCSLPACFRAHEISVPLSGRRTIQETEFIRGAISKGVSLKDLNEMDDLERKLTNQDYYYFKTSLGIPTEYTPPPVLQGENHGCAKLTDALVYAVFARIESGELTDMKQIQAELGVTKSIAYGVVSGRSWKHLHRSDELKARVSSFMRSVLSLDDQKAVIEALLRGDAREEIKETYGLSDSKLQSYITKANKKKKEIGYTP